VSNTDVSVKQHTFGNANNYPLYYFVPSITDDGRFLVFYSERTGWVQHFRLDLSTGITEQLTEGRTWDSGWAIWCEYHLRGIYNHLSALDPASGDVYYFNGSFLERVSVFSGVSKRLYDLDDRMPIGQSAVSPDGKLLAFIHADRRSYTASLSEREVLKNMGRFSWAVDHQQWRNRNPATISIFDIENGTMRNEIELDYHVHHVLFIDDTTLLVNHIRDDNGMWRIGIDGSNERILRPKNENGTICHQIVTTGGILYEAARAEKGVRRSVMGRYNPITDTFLEYPVTEAGYIHTGFDPNGDFIFLELDGEAHGLYAGSLPEESEQTPGRAQAMKLELLHPLSKVPFGQRFHAHPFLSPDRHRVYFTEVIDGFSQILSIDVSQIVNNSTGWRDTLVP
jgi:hypothetical protein